MRVAVTGGTGFVGSRLVTALLERGDDVTLLARASSKTASLEAIGAKVVRVELSNHECLRQALADQELLFHVAGTYDFWLPDKRLFYRDNVEVTRSVMKAALAAGVGKVVHTSTIVTIGERPGEVGNEDTIHRGYFLGEYQRTKTLGEREAFAAYERGLPLVCVNPAGIYGPGDLKPTGRALLDLANGAMPGWFGDGLSLVFIDDVVQGHLLAAERGRIGQRYLLASETESLKQVAERIRDVFGRKVPPHLPRFAAMATAYLSEAWAGVTKRYPMLPLEQARLLLHGCKADGSKATRELGLAYTPFEVGLERTLRWYLDRGLIKSRPLSGKLGKEVV